MNQRVHDIIAAIEEKLHLATLEQTLKEELHALVGELRQHIHDAAVAVAEKTAPGADKPEDPTAQ